MGKATPIDKIETFTERCRAYLPQIFENILSRLGKPTPVVQGHKYLSKILFHGGIPDGSLDDFFNDFLVPIHRNVYVRELEPHDLIIHWLKSPVARRVKLPVYNFLKEGGLISEAFVSRCLDMAQFYDRNSNTDVYLYLPKRIVAKYLDWLRPSTIKNAFAPIFYRIAPYLTLNTSFPDGIEVILPEQRISREEAEENLVWEIKFEGYSKRQFCAIRRTREGVLIEEERILLPYRVSQGIVKLLSGKDILGEWTFKLLDSKHPILLCRISDGRLLTEYSTIPAQDLIIAYPPDQNLTIVGGQLHRQFEKMGSGWENYKIEEWDLTNAQKLQLNEWVCHVTSTGIVAAPYLKQGTGGDILNLKVESNTTTIYIGKLPSIIIPIRDTAELECKRWFIRIEDHTGQTLKIVNLTNSASIIYITNSTLELNLAQLLGEPILGTYKIILVGVGFQTIILPLYFIKKLELKGHDVIRVPNENYEFPPAILDLTTDPNIQVTTTDVSIDMFHLLPTKTVFKSPPIYDRIIICLRDHQNNELSILAPLPRITLKWSKENQTSSIELPSQLPVEEFLRERYTTLHIGITPNVLLQHGDLAGEIHVDRQIIKAKGRFKDKLEYPINQARETIRSTETSHSRIEFVPSLIRGISNPTAFPLLRLTRYPTITDIKLNHNFDSVQAKWKFNLRWQSDDVKAPLTFLLWSTLKREPYRRDLPQSSELSEQWNESLANLPHGKYWFEMVPRKLISTLHHPNKRENQPLFIFLPEPTPQRKPNLLSLQDLLLTLPRLQINDKYKSIVVEEMLKWERLDAVRLGLKDKAIPTDWVIEYLTGVLTITKQVRSALQSFTVIQLKKIARLPDPQWQRLCAGELLRRSEGLGLRVLLDLGVNQHITVNEILTLGKEEAGKVWTLLLEEEIEDIEPVSVTEEYLHLVESILENKPTLKFRLNQVRLYKKLLDFKQNQHVFYLPILAVYEDKDYGQVELREVEIPVAGKVSLKEIELSRYPTQLVGKWLPLVIQSIQNEGKGLVLNFSERTARQVLADRLLSYQTGQKYIGKIYHIDPNKGIYLYVKDIRGYIPLQEMSPIDEAWQSYQKDGRIKVQVLEIDSYSQMVRFSRKAFYDEEWLEQANQIEVGSIVRGLVRSVTNEGVDVALKNHLRGRVSPKEYPDSKNPRFTIGSEHKFRVIGYESSSRLINLSLRQLNRKNITIHQNKL